MITFSKLNNEKKSGRIGNNLFQIASTIGIAKKNNHDYGFLIWKHAYAFKRNLPYYNANYYTIDYTEETFHYDEPYVIADNDKSIDFFGYFQSEKYWAGYEREIRNQFEFTDYFMRDSINGYEYLLNTDLPVIAIHVRRGDYVNNPKYVYLTMAYYHNALKEFGDLSQYTLLVFSDDIEYCKIQFASFKNAFYAECQSDLHALCLMTQCHHFICSNSTFSWWGSYLGAKEDSKVFVPDRYFSGKLVINDTKDFWHSKCIKANTDLDIYIKAEAIIPVTLDSKDRLENLVIVSDSISWAIDLHISCTDEFIDFQEINRCFNYWNYGYLDEFHRTKIINNTSKDADYNIIINWDADCLVPYFQITKAIELIESGQADFVYPYTEWCKVPRSEIPNIHHNDPGFIRNYKIRDNGIDLGGCIVMRKSAFIEAGMENENFKGYGCEDKERYIRWNALGYKVKRIPGKIFHLEHWRGHNSDSLLCTHSGNNVAELKKVSEMNKEQLKEYIKTWEWVK